MRSAPWTGTTFEPIVDAGLRIALIFLVGVLVRFAVHRFVDRVAEGIARGANNLTELERKGTGTAARVVTALASERREQRARTTASVLKSLTTAVIATVVVIQVLDVLRIPVAPVLASAGIAGVALGFGAQSLVKDVISGMFMIVEDQYGVGDIIDIGPASGVVEAVGLRVTRLRDADGTIWYVRNGEVLRVGNRSQGWARAVLDVGIAATEDLARTERLLQEVVRDLAADPAYAAHVVGDPEVAGLEQVTAEAVVIRVAVRTDPASQAQVTRELRLRVKNRLDAAGVQLADPSPP